jgi:hypothetical protein
MGARLGFAEFGGFSRSTSLSWNREDKGGCFDFGRTAFNSSRRKGGSTVNSNSRLTVVDCDMPLRA